MTSPETPSPTSNPSMVGPMCKCGHGMYDHYMCGSPNAMRCFKQSVCGCHQFAPAWASPHHHAPWKGETIPEPNWQAVKEIRDGIFQDNQGWWFLDETEQAIGFYVDEDAATDALDEYTIALSKSDL